jgi:voltage-gated potassium channel
MTVISMTTVGYGETQPLSPTGRVFTMALLVLSFGIMAFAASCLAAFLVEGEFNRLLRGRRMESRIASLHDHVVLCGAGHTGRHIAEELVKTRTPLVIVDRDEAVLQHEAQLRDVPLLVGDATHDDTLREAGIQRASGLVAALSSDKDNVFIVLSARALNPRLRIVTPLIDAENAAKLHTAGADEVVSVGAIGGLRMASVLLRPAVVGFLDEMLRAKGKTMRIEEVQVEARSALDGQTLAAAAISRHAGALVLAVRRRGDAPRFNPPADFALAGGDQLIALGDIDQIAATRRLGRS